MIQKAESKKGCVTFLAQIETKVPLSNSKYESTLKKVETGN